MLRTLACRTSESSISGVRSGENQEQLRKQIIQGNNPINGKPVMKELVELLTKPLTAEEQKTERFSGIWGPGLTPDS